MNDVFAPLVPTDILQNPVRSLADWQAMRAACEADPGAFHAAIATSTLHWFHPDSTS